MDGERNEGPWGSPIVVVFGEDWLVMAEHLGVWQRDERASPLGSQDVAGLTT